MYKKVSIVLGIMLVFLMIAVGCSSKEVEQDNAQNTGSEAVQDQEAGEKVKVAFIFSGPVTDGGWNSRHNEGRLYLEKQLPYVETLIMENVPSGGGDIERAISEMVEKGANVIVATTFGYMDAVMKMAEKYPDVYFLHCTGFKTAENVTVYDAWEYDATYLTGMVAGEMTKTNIIGYAAAHAIPTVVRAINGFAMGVKAVNPEAKIKVVWTNTWYDPATEKEAALSLADVNADVIAQYQDSAAVQQAAQERGLMSIGFHADMKQFAPKANLTSFIWTWGDFYVKEVKAYHDGTWKGHTYIGGMAEGMGDIAPMNKELVSTELEKKVMDTKTKIINGELKIFEGPIKDNNSNLIVPEGKVLSDKNILSMNWLLDNIEGAIPQS